MNSDWRKDYIRYRSLFLNMMTQYRERADIKVYLEIVLSLVTVSIFTLFALRPTLLTIAQLMKDIDAKEEVLAVMETKIQHLAQARSLYELNRSKITILESAIPKTAEPDIFARQIEGLVGSTQIEITSFSINNATILGTTPTAPSTLKQKLPEDAQGMEFTITGFAFVDEYQKLSRFLTDFEKLRRPASVNEVRITRGKEKETDEIIIFIKGQLPYVLYERDLGVN